MSGITLRPMQPTDGPALDGLMRTEAQTTAMSLTTHYDHDVYRALLAQHPNVFGVVAEAHGHEGLVGMATAFLDEVAVGERVLPYAQLENLKVHHDVRRQGLGTRLAAWRIEEARRRFVGDGIIATGIEISNAASLATARHWSTQLLGPVRVVIAPVSKRTPAARGLTVRPVLDGDVEAVVDAANRFYAGHELYPVETRARFAASLAPTLLGEPHRQYRVAVRDDGSIVAGARVTERFKLMTERIERVSRPLALLARVVPMVPPDGVIRSIEVNSAWYAPGEVDAGRHLWESIRFEWRERATHVAGQADPRGPLIDMFHVGRTLIPKVQIMVPVQSQIRLDEQRPVYIRR